MVGDDGYFGEEVAARYDDNPLIMAPAVVGPVVDLLADLAGDGRALEFGVGTGRIALPLSERGVEVHGIDLSRAMIERLRAKPGGDAVGTTVGDFSTTRVGGAFRVVFLVLNTINNVTSQDGQVEVFRNAAAHLEPGGVFLIEVGVPGLQRLPVGERLQPFHLSEDWCGVDEYDVVTQAFRSHHFRVRDGRLHRMSVPFRYVWPAELDLMARIAGLRLRDRWGGWRGEPFTAESRTHVSVWEKPAG